VSRQLQAARTANASTVSGLAGEVHTMSPVVDGMAAFGMVCSQDLTGANGPAQFYFPCTDQKP
jgi:hypothetical protein